MIFFSGYVLLERLCNVIKKLTELYHNSLKEGITFLLSLGSRVIEWRKYIDELQKYVNQIDTRRYHDYTIDEIYFFGDCVYMRENDIIITCCALFQRKYLQMRKHFIP